MAEGINHLDSRCNEVCVSERRSSLRLLHCEDGMICGSRKSSLVCCSDGGDDFVWGLGGMGAEMLA